jgi:hypothetical protein
VEPILLDLLREVAAPFIAPGPRPPPAARHDQPVARFAAALGRGEAPHTVDLPAVRVLAVDPDAGVFWVWDGTDAEPQPAGRAALGVRVRGEAGAGSAGQAASPARRAGGGAASAARQAGRLEPCALAEGEALPADLYARLADRPLPPPAAGGSAGGKKEGGSAAAAAPSLPYPPLGTALPVALLLAAGAPRPPLPSPGAWIRLDKLAGAVVAGQTQALFLESSLWSRAPPNAVAGVEAGAAARVEAAHTAAHAPADPARLVAVPAPGGPAAAAPRGTLRQAAGLAAGPSSGGGSGGNGGRGGRTAVAATPAGGLRVLARILGVHPAPEAAASACVRGPGGLWEFRVTLDLEDGTGRATALAGGPDGGGLFAGVEPRDLGAAPSAAAAVRRRLAALLTPPEEEGGGEGGGVAWADLGLQAGGVEPASTTAASRKRAAPGADPAAPPALRVFGTAAAAVAGKAGGGGRGKRG